MMKLNDFISKLELTLKEPSHYQSGGWGKWNGKSWGWDCVCLIKGILWGWNNDKSKLRGGGAIYGSNGVPDLGDNTMYNVCLKKSNDFTKIEKGELVWMNGHVGVYVGSGNVIEATLGFNQSGVIKSQIDKSGNRTYKGKGGSPKWQGHGFLPYVDYSTDIPKKEDYFIPGGTYKLTSAKYLRTTANCANDNNIVKYNNVDSDTKKICNNISGKAQLKAGNKITSLKVVKDSTGRIWGSYGNCWYCLQNIDGTRNATKI